LKQIAPGAAVGRGYCVYPAEKAIHFFILACRSGSQYKQGFANGNRLWGTYYGGTDEDYGFGIATDAFENIYLCGWTYSTSGISSGGFQNTNNGGDAFLVKFDSFGNRIWATYYGGESGDYGYKVSSDIWGNIYLTGETYSTTGIASDVFQNIHYVNPDVGNILDVFLVKFDVDGNRLWATYYGGKNEEETGNVVTDANGNVYLAADSYSDSCIANDEGFQNTLIGIENPFVIKFDSNGVRLCATYYGAAHDEGTQVAIDNFGHLYLIGFTDSPTGIASDEFQNTYTAGLDGFLVKFTLFGNNIENEEPEIIEIPNVITPNNDNNNDYFEIKTCYSPIPIPKTRLPFTTAGATKFTKPLIIKTTGMAANTLPALIFMCLPYLMEQPEKGILLL
jgi:hypothetical protein